MSTTEVVRTVEAKPAGRTRRSAHPPVKVACLSCRASRTRCDGQPVCSNCLARGKECCYTKSKRGGPRVPRRYSERRQSMPQNGVDVSTNGDDDLSAQPAVQLDSTFDELYNDLVIPMITPGAGLIDLDQDSDYIFNSIFSEQEQHGLMTDSAIDISQPPSWSSSLVRNYNNDEAIINAYYIFIHPYFPILPPPEKPIDVDSPVSIAVGFRPSSPLTLALSAILALIPHPDDIGYNSIQSKSLRRDRAQSFAQQAMEAIELESEVLMSDSTPAHALSNGAGPPLRNKVHPKTPVELESLLAYLLLSIYEYAQRGNIPKMRNRASQAYDAAVRLSLHNNASGQQQQEQDLDEYTEARRRAWWMTYSVVLQSSIVSSLAPIITVNHRQFHTPHPTILSDTEAWPFYLSAQHTILQCTLYTVALKKAQDSGNTDFKDLDKRMATLDREIDTVLNTYSPTTPTFKTSPALDSVSVESIVAGSLRTQARIKLNSARIKLHRYRAFLNAPVFTRRHCDLERKDDQLPSGMPSCSCSGLSRDPGSSPAPLPPLLSGASAPFTDVCSAKQCLKSALAISQDFDMLPYPLTPSTLSQYHLASPHSSSSATSSSSSSSTSPSFTSSSIIQSVPFPRTMPSFACCAMQSCYALLSICIRSRDQQRAWNNSSSGGGSTAERDRGLEELHAGIERVLDALRNYAVAFEAIGGMSEQVEEALRGVKVPSFSCS